MRKSGQTSNGPKSKSPVYSPKNGGSSKIGKGLNYNVSPKVKKEIKLVKTTPTGFSVNKKQPKNVSI
jgi:hypothetical protein